MIFIFHFAFMPHICLFDSNFFIFKCLLCFNSKQVAENTIVCALGRTARQSNVSYYEHRRQQHELKSSCFVFFFSRYVNKAAFKLKCNIRLKLHFKLQNICLNGQGHTSYLYLLIIVLFEKLPFCHAMAENLEVKLLE